MADRRPRPAVTLHRFFVPASALSGGVVEFPSDVSRQMERVLRLRPGDRVIALDASGAEFVVVLETVRRSAQGRVESTHDNQAEPSIELTLYQGLLKGAKMELVVQKCTEIGISRFVPVVTTRSIPDDLSASRRSRFEAIVREAAEQSRRGKLPRIEEVLTFHQAIQAACQAGPTVVLWEDEPMDHLRDIEPVPEPVTVSLFVGPEGGLTREEAEMARTAGARTITLGKRILRAETAAMVGSALLLERYEAF